MEHLQSIQLNLPAHLITTLNAAVENGEYHSANEAAFAAISQWDMRRKVQLEELRMLCTQGINSGAAREKPISEIIAEAKKRFYDNG